MRVLSQTVRPPSAAMDKIRKLVEEYNRDPGFRPLGVRGITEHAQEPSSVVDSK